jgi:hypothetical protein
MNALKKWLGIVWILLGPVAIYYLIKTAAAEIAKKPVIDTKIQWAVFYYRVPADSHWHGYFWLLCCKRGIQTITRKL